MNKKHTFNSVFSKSIDVLSASQMSTIRGGLTVVNNLLSDLGLENITITTTPPVIGPVGAILDDKRRDRPGGGISTH